jgi:hypothetical protein
MALDPPNRLKERIVESLHDRYRKTGINAPVSWRTIWIEMAVTEEDFSKALQAAEDYIVFVDDDQIKLSRRGLPLSHGQRAGVGLGGGDGLDRCCVGRFPAVLLQRWSALTAISACLSVPRKVSTSLSWSLLDRPLSESFPNIDVSLIFVCRFL